MSEYRTGLIRFDVVFFFFSGTFERRHGIFHAHEKKHDPTFSPCYQTETYRTNVRSCSVKHLAVHVSYTTHITSSHYLKNFSLRHLHIAYFTRNLQERREVKTSRSTKKNTAAFWSVRTKSRLFTQPADRNLAEESPCIQREKRSRACKLYDAYRIIAL